MTVEVRNVGFTKLENDTQAKTELLNLIQEFKANRQSI